MKQRSKNRYDSSAVLYILMILEKTPVSRSQLAGRLATLGINYTDRTINRHLLEAENFGFVFQRKGHEIQLVRTDVFSLSMMQLLARWYTESAVLRSCVVGTIDPVRVSHTMENNSISFLNNLVKAVLESRIIEFDYKPQTGETIRRLENFLKRGTISFFKKNATDYMRVKMLPHKLVFSGSDFTLLGETYFSEKDIRQRQYSVNGIKNLSLREPALKNLVINTKELYQYSLNIWINGILYDLEIEEKHPTGESSRKKIKVNGEAEILSYAASKLGNLKILNPPPALVAKARETPGLCEMIFYQKDI